MELTAGDFILVVKGDDPSDLLQRLDQEIRERYPDRCAHAG